jgi:hypothetical protein
MINLDHQLLYQARRLMDGANSHRLMNLMFAYEQAVALHNAGWPTHVMYNRQPERELRSFLWQCRLAELDRRLTASKDFSAKLGAECRRLGDATDQVELSLASIP